MVDSALTAFQWKPQPEAQRLIDRLLDTFVSACPPAAALKERMAQETGTRFKDWVDHVALGGTYAVGVEGELRGTGFEPDGSAGREGVWHHPGAIFPRVVLERGEALRAAVRVERIDDFLAAQQVPPEVEVLGEPLATLRTARVGVSAAAELWAIERHGDRGFVPPAPDARRGVRMMHHLEQLRRRRRDFPHDAEGIAHVEGLAEATIAELGRDLACDVFFAAERDFWQRRNRAARVQKGRQDALGLGWANHDHHTYRSSRALFPRLIGLFERLGFSCRERFYAGAEAGWGAQVLEQPVTGITIFADVDMSPEELLGDFAHAGFSPRQELGTVGLWCALHGDSILQAGMHHLECQFDWHALRAQLERESVRTMDPFTAFPHLRQAFTEGERWAVRRERIDRLEAAGQITREQADQFRAHGAVGSHLENLERNDGFKGFNQTGVSDIIARTDPRRLVAAGS